MNAQAIKQEFDRNVSEFKGEQFSRGAVIGVLNYACHNDANRHLVLKFLTGKISSKELTDAEWFGLFQFVKPFKPEGGKWTTAIGDENLRQLCGAILTAVVDQPGQERMFG